MEICKKIDSMVIEGSKKLLVPFTRLSLFVIYFWFGILKIFDVSSASPMVSELLQMTMPFMSYGTFIVIFSIFEMVIGVLFLFPKLSRVALVFLAAHVIMITMPLVLLPSMVWTSFAVPTLEGQYIIKNLLIIAAGIVIASNLRPLKEI